MSLRRMLARCRWTVCSLKKSRWACAARAARISQALSWPRWLVIVALGLLTFGVYSWCEARWRAV